MHTADYNGADEFAGQHVLVVGGGASAVQLLAEISEVASTTWVTRRPPEWRTGEEFGPEIGRQIIAKVEERVRAGLPPKSVVAVTGLQLREQEQAALPARRLHPAADVRADHARRRALGGRRMERVDAILWATGFRADLGASRAAAPARAVRRRPDGRHAHRAGATRPPDRLRPSASTIGGNRAGFAAARELRDLLQPVAA